MAVGNPVTTTFRAAAATNLSAQANVGLGVALDTDGRLVLAGANGRDRVGILVDGGRAAGDPCLVAISGLCRAQAGGAIVEGDYVTSEAGGGMVVADEADDLFGICVQRTDVADGQMFDLLLSLSGGSTAPQP